MDGISLEAGTHLHANDRQGLEHLCRYGLRPPLSLRRLSRLADGRVLFTLRKEGHDGVRALAFTPSELLRRLCANVPPPRSHLVRYFGVFAPRSAIRARLVPRPPPEPQSEAGQLELPLPREGCEPSGSPESFSRAPDILGQDRG